MRICPRFIIIVCVFSPSSPIISDVCFSTSLTVYSSFIRSIISFLIQQTSKTLNDTTYLSSCQSFTISISYCRFLIQTLPPSPFESLILISTPDSSPNYNYRSRCQLHSRFKHSGIISPDDVIEIAKFMHSRSMAKELQGTVKEILRNCVSVGCTVHGKDPKDLQQEIVDGDVEIPRD